MLGFDLRTANIVTKRARLYPVSRIRIIIGPVVHNHQSSELRIRCRKADTGHRRLVKSRH